jgi:hypothetical protein
METGRDITMAVAVSLRLEAQGENLSGITQ